MCVFPETRRADDFVSVTYNSNIDVDLTDIENDEVYFKSKHVPPTAPSTPWCPTR